MASAITTQSNTLEGQLLEIVHAICELEANPETNPDGLKNATTQWSISTNDYVWQGNIVIRMTGKVNSQGRLTLTPNEYLVNPQTPGVS